MDTFVKPNRPIDIMHIGYRVKKIELKYCVLWRLTQTIENQNNLQGFSTI